MTDTPNETEPPSAVGQYVQHESTNDSHNITTTFADDTIGSSAHIENRSYSVHAKIGRGKQAPATDSISSFLERPSSAGSGVFTSSDTGVIFSADLNGTLLSTLKRNRMAYIYGMRFDLKFTLQINADRFQAGRYIMGFLPYGGGYTAAQRTAWYAMHMANLTTITQLPHVEIDFAKETHVTLTIPYTYTLSYLEYSTNSTTFKTPYGVLFIIPYYPLIPGSGGSQVPYTVWASLQAVQLASVSVNQMASVGDKEAQAQDIGPLTSVLAKVSRATGVLGSIPVLGPWASQVSWLSEILASSASYMGWSKPTALAAPLRMHRQVLPFSGSSDVAAYPHTLGVMSTNSVISHTGVGNTEHDEMSIDFIKSQYAYISTINWTSANTAGTNLQTFGHRLDDKYVSWSKGFAATPICFLANLFTYWRGGIIFRFKLVKTEFHRGRLMVAYSPLSYATTDANFTYANSELIFREIIDISTTSEFEVCVPYMVAKNWTTQTATAGTMLLFVENQLTAPPTVSSTVPIIVEVKGASDLEFGAPTNTIMELYAPSTNQMADPYVATPCITLGVSSPQPDIAAYTMGEKVTSLRQLVKRMSGLFSSVSSIPASNSLQLPGYSVWVTTQAATTAGALSRPNTGCDIINLIQGLFLFTTGSMRFMVYAKSAAQLGVDIEASPTTTDPIRTVTTYYNWYNKTLVSPAIEGVIDIQLPVWQPGTARAFVDHITGSNIATPINTQYGDACAATIRSIDPAEVVPVSVYRTVGEDYNAFGWCGVPAMVLSTTT